MFAFAVLALPKFLGHRTGFSQRVNALAESFHVGVSDTTGGIDISLKGYCDSAGDVEHCSALEVVTTSRQHHRTGEPVFRLFEIEVDAYSAGDISAVRITQPAFDSKPRNDGPRQECPAQVRMPVSGLT